MPFLAGDNIQLSVAGDWARMQASHFNLVESATITQASEVTAQSIADYYQTIADQRTKDFESTPSAYTPIAF